MRDLTNQKFGRLTVLSRSLQPSHKVMWLCQCDCGTQKTIRGSHLISGNSTSCGCRSLTPRGAVGFKRLMAQYRRNAKVRNVPFLLTEEEVATLTKLPCHYCGTEPTQSITGPACSDKARLNSTYTYNGIDRIDSAAGYGNDNVVPCCGSCNRAKLDMSYDEFRQWLRRAYKHWAAGGDIG